MNQRTMNVHHDPRHLSSEMLGAMQSCHLRGTVLAALLQWSKRSKMVWWIVCLEYQLVLVCHMTPTPTVVGPCCVAVKFVFFFSLLHCAPISKAWIAGQWFQEVTVLLKTKDSPSDINHSLTMFLCNCLYCLYWLIVTIVIDEDCPRSKFLSLSRPMARKKHAGICLHVWLCTSNRDSLYRQPPSPYKLPPTPVQLSRHCAVQIQTLHT